MVTTQSVTYQPFNPCSSVSQTVASIALLKSSRDLQV